MSDFSHIRYNEASNDLWRSEQMFRWSFMLRPRIFPDGNKWCALLGDSLQEGVCGFGDSPDEAYAAFDQAWTEKMKPLPTKDEIMALHDKTMSALRGDG